MKRSEQKLGFFVTEAVQAMVCMNVLAYCLAHECISIFKYKQLLVVPMIAISTLSQCYIKAISFQEKLQINLIRHTWPSRKLSVVRE